MEEAIIKLNDVIKNYKDNKELYEEEDINLKDLIDLVLFEKPFNKDDIFNYTDDDLEEPLEEEEDINL